jgi:hypothetical protein
VFIPCCEFVDGLTCLFRAAICRTSHNKLELVVRVRSFFSLSENGSKTWFQGRTLPAKVIDPKSFRVVHLVDFIGEHCFWGSKQYVTLWRDLEEASIEIKSDENLLEWFQLHDKSGLVCINAQVNDFEGALDFSPTKRRFHPTLRANLLSIEGGSSERDTNRRATTPPKKRHSSPKKESSSQRKCFWVKRYSVIAAMTPT